MAKARAIIKRRKAVSNIRKITRTMQLIATARFQRFYQRAVQAKAYTAGITELVEELAAVAGRISHPLLQTNDDAGRCVLLVITTNRGLCGGYNSNIVRTALEVLDQHRRDELDVDLHMVGKKGISRFRFLRRPVVAEYTQFESTPQYGDVEAIAQQLMDQYADGRISRADVVYMRFVSTGSQRAEVLSLLPISDLDRSGQVPARSGLRRVAAIPPEHYDFSPNAETLLGELLPTAVKVRLYQCFMDAAVSEQVARMVAMGAATDAAGEMIRYLSQRYNRARQSQITLDLLDILGGTEALK
jgi:F-type H+-transporting ATPase subunit gamma